MSDISVGNWIIVQLLASNEPVISLEMYVGVSMPLLVCSFKKFI